MILDYIHPEKLPLFWCAGCGNGIVFQSILRSMDKHNLKKEETAVVTGIGCWGKADDYMATNSFHGTHGRALAFSTGMKLANPDLHVFTLMGDGDGITIGGNHLIHAARRNLDLVVVMVNNLNYGMTGGQYSGTTPKGAITKTSVYGHVEDGFDVCDVVRAAGATFVARGTVMDVVQLNNLIDKAVEHKGFSFVEVISPCPTHYGKNNKQGAAPKMMQYIKDHTVPVAKAKDKSREELVGKYVTGIFADYQKDDYMTSYQRIIDSLKPEEIDPDEKARRRAREE